MTTTPPSTIGYALLGLLGIRSWTGYELTQQFRRSLRYAWPTSEGHLYREHKRLVRLGWATVEKESVGKRTRNRYTITDAGRAALVEWLETEPAPPGLDIEGIVRVFLADQGSVESLAGSLRATAAHARSGLDRIAGIVEDYLETGGSFPERMHVNTLTMEITTSLLVELERFCVSAAADIETWDTTAGHGMTDDLRARLEAMLALAQSPSSARS